MGLKLQGRDQEATRPCDFAQSRHDNALWGGGGGGESMKGERRGMSQMCLVTSSAQVCGTEQIVPYSVVDPYWFQIGS
jgi:hypothetical protein